MVNIKIENTVLTAEAGERLSDVFKRAGLHVDYVCGGRGTCGKCKVTVNGRDELACRYIIRDDIEVVLPKAEDIFSETGVTVESTADELPCLVLDLGTTTLALAAVAPHSGRVLNVVTASNPQRAFGADVITRIAYCQTHPVQELQTAVAEEVDRMISRLGVSNVEKMYVAANVTMLHILLGVDCTPIGVAPYTPAFLESQVRTGDSLGIHNVKTVITLPSVSSFVGADIVAGLYAVGMPADQKYRLLIDLGTNAEVVLFSADGGVATSAAAGPCFEGANISCGMSATAGAIYAFSMEGGKPTCRTIANESPRGICGTGLIDVVATLLTHGIIDETGYMEDDFALSDSVLFTDGDVRQYQLAKSAIYSAVLTLMKTVGVEFEDIATLYVSGGFSAKINIANAVRSGLLPAELADRTVALNNSSLQGGLQYACRGGDLDAIATRIRYVDLSSSPYFSEQFMQNMMFE